ncbi:MAG TPA: membrane dipeptidase, partial [Candidatus Limnocylindria bacterium]|nr:membrane dipeptidase [Candidatus Limnocylindria bacterium]
SLGVPARSTGSDIAMAEWLIGRIVGWCDQSDGQLVVVRSRADIERCLAPGGPVGVFIGVQGGHVIEGDLANLARLRAAGVRMFAPAHVMDNALVGSGTGRLAAGITDFGREVIAELEAQSIVLDLAHMSVAGVEQTLPFLTRPFALSHTGLSDVHGGGSRWRRFSARTRNVPASLAAEVGAAGGLLGVTLSTQLLGGSTLSDAARTFRAAIDAAGADHVAIGSDMDGALRMVIDVEGLPALAGALLDSGLAAESVGNILGANAVRLLRAVLPG